MNKLKNNISQFFYTLKLMWKFSKTRVISVAIQSILGYFEWVFYSSIFMQYIVSHIESEKEFLHMLRFIGATVLFFSMAAIFNNYVDNVVIPLTDKVIYKNLYRIIYKKAINVELRCFEDSEFYNKYTLATKDAAENMTLLIKNFFGVVTGAVAVIAVFAIMFKLDHLAVLFIIAPISGNFVFGTLLNRINVQINNESVKPNRIMDYVNRVFYLNDYAKEIRLSKVYRLMKNKYNEAMKDAIEVNNKHAKKAFILYWFKVYLTFTVIFQGVLIYGVYRATISKTMSLAELAVLCSVMIAATWILIYFTNDVMDFNKKGLLIANIHAFLEYEENIPEDFDGIIPDKKIHSIEFKDVSFSYSKDKPVIQGLSFRIKENMSVALVGHNGAGKSTIIKLIFRMYDPTEGKILVNGIDIRNYNLREYRRLYATAFQDYKIFAMSIRENVLMKKADLEDLEEEKRVEDALIKAGAYEFVKSLPNKMNTILTKEFDDNGIVLSGGQFQKIVLARAFAHDASIKIFDEPSSALDPIAEAELFDSIIEESKDKIMIYISHRLSSVRNADVVYMLENGTLIEQGSHEKLMALCGAYADMYKKQCKNYLAEDDSSVGA